MLLKSGATLVQLLDVSPRQQGNCAEIHEKFVKSENSTKRYVLYTTHRRIVEYERYKCEIS